MLFDLILVYLPDNQKVKYVMKADLFQSYFKGLNQPQLLEHIEDEFRFCKSPPTFEHIDFGHGRIETRGGL